MGINCEGSVKTKYNDSTPRSSINFQIFTQLMTIFLAQVWAALMSLVYNFLPCCNVPDFFRQHVLDKFYHVTWFVFGRINVFQYHTSSHAVAVSGRDVNKCLLKHDYSCTTRNSKTLAFARFTVCILFCNCVWFVLYCYFYVYYMSICIVCTSVSTTATG
jgi:hypothetical protein